MKTSLSYRGYGIEKSSLSEEHIHNIKKTLTVRAAVSPNMPQSHVADFYLYCESSKKLYIPRNYGLKEFGLPLVDQTDPGDDINCPFVGDLRAEQEGPIHAFMEAAKDPLKRGGIINLCCGAGKCLGYNTPVLMYNGHIKMVQDIVVGDILMGDDSSPRNVMSLARGKEQLYKIVPSDTKLADAYIVNASHILSLKNIFTGQVEDVSLIDYLNLSAQDKKQYRGYTVIVHFNKYKSTNDTNYEYSFTVGYNCNLQQDQSIKNIYKCASFRERVSFLSGFVHRYTNSIPLCDLSPTIREDIRFIARSVGLNAYNSADGLYFVIDHNERCKTYHFNVIEYNDSNEYFGFEIDGNRRFLLGDFSVTHNTVIGLNLVSRLNKKAMIVVHKDFLLAQWRERISQFLPSARVGLIKAKVVDVDNKDIVIASLQSLSMKDYDKDVFKGFGFLIMDEVHRTATEVFSKAFKKINTLYTLGLSATLKRADGLSKVFTWYIGDIVFKKQRRRDLVHVQQMPYFDTCPAYNTEVRIFNRNLNTARMLNNIASFLPRTRMVCETMMDVLKKEPNRRILVLSDRKGQLADIKKHMESINGAPFAISCGYYIGGMNEEDLKESEKCKIILATYSFASEGFDAKGLDTLVMASPKTNIEQSVGRILRLKEEERQHIPLVIDIVDMFSVFENQGRNRAKYYKKQGYVFVSELPSPTSMNSMVESLLSDMQGVCLL